MDEMTKLQKAQIIYEDLAKTLLVFGTDITTPGASAAVKGCIYSSLEKIEEQQTTN